MMRIKNIVFIVTMSFVGGMYAMDQEAAKKAEHDHSKMIEALTFDAAKGRYYYKPIFKRTAKGIYSLLLTDFSEKEICIDPGPAKLFWILRGRSLVKAGRGSTQNDLLAKKYDQDQRKRFGNDDYSLIPQAQQRVNEFKELGALEYDLESDVYFHVKKFRRKASLSELGSDDECLGDMQYDSGDEVYYRPRLKKSALAPKTSVDKPGLANDELIMGDLTYDPEVGTYFFSSCTKEDLAAEHKVSSSRSNSDEDASSSESSQADEDNMDIEEWLRHVAILSFDHEKRRYCYKYLFEGNRDQQGLKLCNEDLVTIDRGPLGLLVTDLTYSGYDNFRGVSFWTVDHTRKSLENKLGEYRYRDSYGGTLYYAKVFELTDK